MTQRRRLDAFLLDAAREHGRRGSRGRDGRVRATSASDGERVDGDVVVGADGANGTTARAVGLGERDRPRRRAEGNVAYGDVSRERYERRAVVELADIPGGYGWVFPKGDHVNVGVGGWQSEGPRLREHLRRVCAAHGLEPTTSRACVATACRCAGQGRGSPASGRCSSATRPD